jgi:hypothetical protein
MQAPSAPFAVTAPLCAAAYHRAGEAGRTPPRSARHRRRCTRRMWFLLQTKQLWIRRHASGEVRQLHASERCAEVPGSGIERRTPQPGHAGFPSGRKSLCEAAAGRPAPARPSRAVSRRTARRAHVRPMPARARVLAVPGSANDSIGCGDPDTRPRGVLSRHRQRNRGPVAGVQADSQGLRRATTFLTSSTGEQHAPVVATPAQQQETRTCVSHRLAVRVERWIVDEAQAQNASSASRKAAASAHVRDASFAASEGSRRSARDHYLDLRSPASMGSGPRTLGDHSSTAGVLRVPMRDPSEAAPVTLQAGARRRERLAE